MLLNKPTCHESNIPNKIHNKLSILRVLCDLSSIWITVKIREEFIEYFIKCKRTEKKIHFIHDLTENNFNENLIIFILFYLEFKKVNLDTDFDLTDNLSDYSIQPNIRIFKESVHPITKSNCVIS